MLEPTIRRATRLAFAMLHDRSEAEDAFQDAALRAWRRLQNLRDGSPFQPWFMGIVANQCREIRRSKWWHTVRLPDVNAMPSETLRRNLDTAFDPGPDFPNPLLLSRTIAMLDAAAAAAGRDGRWNGRERPWLSWPRPAMRLAAILMAVIVAVAATATFLAVHRFFAPLPAHTSPFKVGNTLLPVGNSWFFSANDGAVQVELQHGLFITHDGGRTWIATSLNVLDFPLVNLRWLDSQRVVALLDQVGPPNLLETTADGGANWQSTKMAFLNLQPGDTFLPRRSGRLGPMHKPSNLRSAEFDVEPESDLSHSRFRCSLAAARNYIRVGPGRTFPPGLH